MAIPLLSVFLSDFGHHFVDIDYLAILVPTSYVTITSKFSAPFFRMSSTTASGSSSPLKAIICPSILNSNLADLANEVNV
jgi:hypothetical protein